MNKTITNLRCWMLLAAIMLSVGTIHSVEYLYKKIDNIYYTLDSDTKEAKVESYGEKYVGNIVIPAEVTYLNEVYSVTAINYFAFENCTRLYSVSLPESIKSIGSSAFSGCSSLTSFTIPKNVSSIGLWAFKGCRSLSKIYARMTEPCTMGNSVFENIASSATVYVPFGSKPLYESASQWKALIIVENPEVGDTYERATTEGVKLVYKVTNVDEKTCEVVSLAEGSSVNGTLTLPSEAYDMTVTAIGSNAFKDCTGLQNVIIPASVATIKYQAFKGCSNLTAVHIRCSTPPATGVIPLGGWNAFDGISAEAILYVPVGTKSAYQNAGWSEFKEIKEERVNNELFTALTEEGVSMQFMVLSTENMTCAVGSGNAPAIDTETAGAVTIPSEVEGFSVVSINNNAFSDCVKMTSISLPNTITSINGNFSKAVSKRV